MKVLVTGGAGFIGKNLIIELYKRRYNIRCLVRKESDISQLKKFNCEFVYGDLLDTDSLKKAVNNVDYIFHLAGQTKRTTKEQYFKINSEGARNLAEACLTNKKIKKIVFISSIAATGPSKDGKKLNENSFCNPVDNYGRSKLSGERILLKYKEKLPITLLRPPMVYGPHEKNILKFFKLAKKGIWPIFGNSKTLISPIYIDDLINGLIFCAESNKTKGEVFFICDDNAYTWKDIGETMAKSFNKKLKFIHFPREAGIIILGIGELIFRLAGKNPLIYKDKLYKWSSNWICDNSKLKGIGFKIKTSFPEGIKKTVKWYKKENWL